MEGEGRASPSWDLLRFTLRWPLPPRTLNEGHVRTPLSACWGISGPCQRLLAPPGSASLDCSLGLLLVVGLRMHMLTPGAVGSVLSSGNFCRCDLSFLTTTPGWVWSGPHFAEEGVEVTAQPTDASFLLGRQDWGRGPWSKAHVGASA